MSISIVKSAGTLRAELTSISLAVTLDRVKNGSASPALVRKMRRLETEYFAARSRAAARRSGYRRYLHRNPSPSSYRAELIG